MTYKSVLIGAMRDMKVSRAELARRLGVSRAYVTQALSDKSNLSLDTVVQFASALGCEVAVSIKSREV